MSKHKNYEILNLIGYGLSKFDNLFIKEFGFNTKKEFYSYCVKKDIAKNSDTIKNRMDLFDPFFPNDRKGWWQKGDTYLHRKIFIDNLFGNENVKDFANIVKLYINDTKDLSKDIKPIIKSKFKKLQETGLEAEIYFMQNFNQIPLFKDAKLEDARLFGDGYDFQVNTQNDYFLAEIKGIKEKKGKFRLTQNEYNKALEYKDRFVVTVVINLDENPKFITIQNPVKNLNFTEKINIQKEYKEYHLQDYISY